MTFGGRYVLRFCTNVLCKVLDFAGASDCHTIYTSHCTNNKRSPQSLPWGDKWPWLLLLLVNIIGPIIYFVVGSNKLDEKAAEYQDLQERQM